MSGAGIDFRILGPIEVRIGGADVRIGGPRQRALLAILLLSANRVVSRDRLIYELLADVPTDGANHALRVQVSRLRKTLTPDGGEPRILARPPGYLLRVEEGELDLQRFERRLDEAGRALEQEDWVRAAGILRQAESLWRGRPLADLEFEPFAHIEIERLEELRLLTAEERIDAELALGRHAMLVAEVEARVGENPFRERLRGQLMLALYRCGRQADALEVYRAGRSLLSEELALEPGPALRELERSILRQEPVLEVPGKASSVPATGAAHVALLENPAVTEIATALSRPDRRRGRTVIPALVVGIAVIVMAVVLLARGPKNLTAQPLSLGVIDAGKGVLTAVLPAEGRPGGIAAGAGAIWETDTADDQLLQINPASHSVERIPVGRGPTGVATGDGQVWVVNQLDRTVSEINPAALKQVASFQVGNGASAAAYGDHSLWVANVIDDTVSRIDPTTGSVTTIPLAGQPGGLAVGPDGVWVASASTGQLLLIDPRSNKVTQAVPIGSEPAGVSVGFRSVWVANTTEGTVSRYDPGSGTVTKVNVGEGPVGVTCGGGAVWAAISVAGTIARIDPASNAVRLVRVGAAPTALAINGQQVWTAFLPGPASHRGGSLTVQEAEAFTSTGKSLDPAQFAGLSQWQVLSLTNDGLVTYRRVGGLAGSTLVPDLATALPVPTDGGRTYTFRVRSGIRYSTGTLVRPEDFRHELERVFTLGDSYAETFYTGIVGAQACLRAPRSCSLATGVLTDDATNTVTFHLTAPDPDFLYKLAFPWADAVPTATPSHDLGRSMPPATGPYMTASITPSGTPGAPGHALAFHSWTVVRNPRFRSWQSNAQPPGYPDRIVLTQGGSARRAVGEIEHGNLDVLLMPPVSRLRELAVHYTTQLHSEPAGATFAPVMNTRVAPFDRVLVRRALNYAIDRQRIVALAGGPFAVRPTCQILPPTLPGYRPYCPYTAQPSASGSWSGPDLTKAQRLVTASGTRGMKVTLVIPPSDATNPAAKVGAYLVSVLDRLGYRASVRVSDDLYRLAADSRSRIQIAWFNWYEDYPAPSDFIRLLLACRSFLPHNSANINEAEFCSPKIDVQVRRAGALAASAPGAASEAWTQIDRAITDQAPWLPLYNPQVNVATSSRVGNFEYHPFWVVLLDQLWVR